MVSRQLVYVTGMLEVILAPSDPSGRHSPARLEAKCDLGAAAAACEVFLVPGNLGWRP